MTGFTTGLTRIRDVRDEISPSPMLQEEALRNPTPETRKALLIKAEIDRLIENRDSLIQEIGGLEKQGIPTKRQIAREITILKNQKIKFIEQVKALGNILFIFQQAEGRGKIHFDQFFSEREDLLVNFSSLVTKSLDRRAKLLKIRAGDLQKDADLVDEMYTYATELLNSSEKRFSEVTEAKKSVDLDLNEVAEMKKSAERDFKKVSELLKQAESKLLVAKQAEIKASDILKSTTGQIEKEKSMLEIWSKAVGVREKVVKSEAEENEIFGKELDDREKWLDDREKTLGRTIRRLGLESML